MLGGTGVGPSTSRRCIRRCGENQRRRDRGQPASKVVPSSLPRVAQIDKGVRVDVGHGSADVRFEEAEEREPNLLAFLVRPDEVVVVGLPVVVEEEAGGDVDGDEDVD